MPEERGAPSALKAQVAGYGRNVRAVTWIFFPAACLDPPGLTPLFPAARSEPAVSGPSVLYDLAGSDPPSCRGERSWRNWIAPRDPAPFNEMFALAAGVFETGPTRKRARWYLLGLLSQSERKNGSKRGG